MRERGHLLTIIAALIIAVFALHQPASTQSGDCIQLLVNGATVYESDACGVSPTPTPTNTPVPPTPTPTPEPGEHDVTAWHAPAEGHHHGYDPFGAEIHPEIQAFLSANPDFASIGHPWLSSPNENVWPFPGKHQGFTNLAEADTGCPQGRAQLGKLCVNAYYHQVHTLGLAESWRERFHSTKVVWYVCGPDNQPPCGIVATGGLVDYGTRHSQYKHTICDLPSNPPLPDGSDIQTHQPPYITVNGSQREWFFWSSQINSIVEPYYDPVPNQLFEVTWTEGPWEVPALDPALCADAAHDELTGKNGTFFQGWGFRINIDAYPRPYTGWVDANGYDAPGCTEAGPDCIPLFIEGTVPAGDVGMSRNIRHGNCDYSPCQDFDDGSAFVIPGG